jgi:hypothetical protein
MEKRLSIALVILGMLFLTMFLIQESENKKLKNKISEQTKDLIYKDEVIEAQAKMIIQNEYNNCYCGWYEDFYYQYADEVGAYE